MRALHPFLIMSCLLPGLVLGGCRSSAESVAPRMTHTFSYESQMYRVEIRQREREEGCLRRDALFTALNRLYTEPYVSRVRAVDIGCDATDVTDFEEFEILRSPDQIARYANNYAFRNRVNEDLWDTYQAALFKARQV